VVSGERLVALTRLSRDCGIATLSTRERAVLNFVFLPFPRVQGIGQEIWKLPALSQRERVVPRRGTRWGVS